MLDNKTKCKCKQCNQNQEIYPETKQIMIRPKLNLKKAAVLSVLVLLIDVALAYGAAMMLSKLDISVTLSFGWRFAVMFALFLIGTMILLAKQIVIFIIRLYQRYAPYDIRSKCLFVPNCSEYMILAIRKYGLFKGIKKGISRYNRCCVPNGGIDYP